MLNIHLYLDHMIFRFTRNIKINSHIDFQINASLVKSIICKKDIEKCQKNLNEIQIYEAFS